MSGPAVTLPEHVSRSVAGVYRALASMCGPACAGWVLTPDVRAGLGASLPALVLALPRTNCVTSAKLLNLSVPWFPNADSTFLLTQMPRESHEMLWVESLPTAPGSRNVPSEGLVVGKLPAPSPGTRGCACACVCLRVRLVFVCLPEA